MGRIIKLINVSAQNNNKFYDMIENSDGTWTAHYGRVGANGVKEIYSIGMWDKKYKEKLKKGYRDITDLVSIQKEDNSEVKVDSSSSKVIELINFLQKSAKDTIKSNYTVSVADVTEKQLESAQIILDELVGIKTKSTDTINSNLLELYKIIPRKMKNTKDYLLNSSFDNKFFKELLSNEQNLLDVMRGQVTTVKDKKVNIVDLNIMISDATKEDIKNIKDNTDLLIGKNDNIFVVDNSKYSKIYDSNDIKNSKLLYHGSRNENWWSIINNGLKIRPANAIHTGSMFGNGIYMANRAKKSLGYSSLNGSHWAKGGSSKAFLALYEVNCGKIWDLFKNGSYSSWMGNLNIKKCKEKGYDSVYAKKGADLYNDEYIIYEEYRCKIKYLIEINK
jgi:poly [ADP-ribose] polymerase